MKFVPGVIGRQIARNSLHLQKASPQVLFGVGVVGMVGSTVLACRATLKMDEVLTEAQRKLEVANSLQHPDYSESDRSRDRTLIRYQAGVKIVRAYIPAIVVGGISIYALSSSHRILTKRNAGLVAAYGALEQGFNQYRARVVEKYGEEEDRNLRYGSRQVEIEDPETGKKTTVTRVGIEVPSVYARFFDSSSPSWNREPEYNLVFLKCQQNYANDLLRSRGHIFLNEVYDMLGIPRSQAGAVVGWVLSKHGETDNFVNFGVFDGRTEQARDFVNGFEGSILLDFNVDGVVYDKLDE